MNNKITEYPKVSNKRLEKKIRTTTNIEDVSIFLELAYLRRVVSKGLDRPYEHAIDCGQ